MKLEREEVIHLSTLSKIELSEEEIEPLEKGLASILNFVEQLKEVSTENVEPMLQITGQTNVTREDTENYTFEKSDMIASMPDTDDAGHLRVHTVFKNRTQE